MKEIQNDCKIFSTPCKTCPFIEGGLIINPLKMAEIRQYLLKGVNHFCHNDRTDNTICRGGRNYQLEIWAKVGIIDEPTDEALAKAMIEVGKEPRNHIIS